jgi:hypothetical protein
MGEVLRVTDPHAVVDMQKARDIRFFNQDQIRKLELLRQHGRGKPSLHPQHRRLPGTPRVRHPRLCARLGSIREDMQAA